MVAAVGILTSRGGKNSHAAVVARGMGKPAVCGADQLIVDESSHTAVVKLDDGQRLTINEGVIRDRSGGDSSVNRGSSAYTTRWSKFTLSGVDASTQAST
jgi:pyruvate,orthophosphate dikinase